MQQDLIYDWNEADREPKLSQPTELMLDDETLRDGLQSPSVIDPPIEAKKRILHLMEALGVETADVGLPGAGPRAARDVEALCREIVDAKLNIRPNCAARTVIQDIEPCVRISDATGIAIEACVFIGSSPIRQYAEGWDEEFLLKQSAEAIGYAVKAGLPVMYVTEDASRAQRLRNRHGRTRYGRGHGEAAGLHSRGTRRGRWPGRRHRLARPPRPRFGAGQLPRRVPRRSDPGPRVRARHRRTLR
jgi:hypothetical protein